SGLCTRTTSAITARGVRPVAVCWPTERSPACSGKAGRGCLTININTCGFIDVKQASALYRLLGDEARLRLLRVLSRERLNVTELTGVLGLAQSGVSRHLGLLKEAGLVAEERDGGFSYYRASALAGADSPLTA